MIGRVNRDERPVAIAFALGVCVIVYIVGAVLVAVIGSIFDLSQGLTDMFGLLLLICSLMAAVVIMLRDKSRRT
jgi:hypothetical protein